MRNLMRICPLTVSLSPEAAVTVSARGDILDWLTSALWMMLTAAPLSTSALISCWGSAVDMVTCGLMSS